MKFTTVLAKQGNNTGIVVPPEVIEKLGAGKRPPVLVNVNGYEYRSTVAVMGGQFMIGVSAAIRKATGLVGGETINVHLTLATAPRDVNVPADLAKAFESSKEAKAYFDTLSNSLQRYHIDNIEGAKTPATRERRIDKAIALFENGKPR